MIFLTLTDQFQNLRRIKIFGAARFDEALVLPNLEMYDIYRDDPLYANSTAFKSVNLPNLRRLSIAHSTEVESFGHIYDSIIPQLDHISLTNPKTGDFDHILRLTTSLQSLDIDCSGPYTQTPTIRDQLVNLDVKELRFAHEEMFDGEDWETHLGSIKVFKEVLDKNDHLKAVHLTFEFCFIEGLSGDACDQSLAWWKQIKEDMRLICVRKEIKILNLGISIKSGYDYALTWQDELE